MGLWGTYKFCVILSAPSFDLINLSAKFSAWKTSSAFIDAEKQLDISCWCSGGINRLLLRLWSSFVYVFPNGAELNLSKTTGAFKASSTREEAKNITIVWCHWHFLMHQKDEDLFLPSYFRWFMLKRLKLAAFRELPTKYFASHVALASLV